jgi:AcrR family transcriptional regulator
MPKVTQEHVDARRNQILDAAWTCFGRNGYHGATIDDICRESELSPGAVYRYFASKEDILKAISERSHEMGRALVSQARSLAAGPEDALGVIGDTMFAVFEDPMFEANTRLNIEIQPEIIRNPALREGARKELTFWLDAVSGLLRAAKADGRLATDVDPESLAILCICAWQGMREYRLIAPDEFAPASLRHALEALIGDVASAAGAESRGRLSDTQGPPFGTHLTAPLEPPER